MTADRSSTLERTTAGKCGGSSDALTAPALHVRPGDLFAVLGPNGAGKTTAIGLGLGRIDRDAASACLFRRLRTVPLVALAMMDRLPFVNTPVRAGLVPVVGDPARDITATRSRRKVWKNGSAIERAAAR